MASSSPSSFSGSGSKNHGVSFLVMSFGSLLFSVFGFQGTSRRLPGYGDGEIRTLDPLLARQVLSQLSYAPLARPAAPAAGLMGLSGLEPPTSRLSGVRSNRLSYKPFFLLLFLLFSCFLLF